MANLTEDILRVSIKKIEAHAESIMMRLNILLSKPESSDSIIDETCELVEKLSIANLSLEQARLLFAQTPGQRTSAIAQLLKQKAEVERIEKEELEKINSDFPETSRINSDEEE
jgi:hypothetical protein